MKFVEKKKIFKFYAHHGVKLLYETQKTRPSVFKFLYDVSFGVCFRLGQMLLKTGKKIKHTVKKELLETGHNLKLRSAKFKNLGFARSALLFIFVAFLSYSGILATNFLARGLELKSKLLNFGQNGAKYLLEAKTDFQNKNATVAENKFQLAYDSFQNAQKQLYSENILLNELLNLAPQKKDAENLLEAASLLSEAGKSLSESYSQISSLKLTGQGLVSQSGDKPDLTGLSLNLKKSIEQTAQAGKLLMLVNPNSLPKEYGAKLVLIQGNYQVFEKSIESLRDLVSLGAGLTAGQKNILLLLENNNELRPGGGFLGTYGLIKLSDGSLKTLNVSSIYDLDGQLNEKIMPPFPLLAVNDRWFMRDSNWFADFPESVKKISAFYEQEGGETPDAVVVITPSFIQSILRLTGPIDLPKYGVSLTAENFVETIQLESSVMYDQSLNRPKQILQDLLPKLLEKLGTLPKDKWAQFLQLVQDGLNQKQSVLYSRDADTQKLIESFNWGGQIKETDRDYLSIVSANLSGSKSDLFIKQSIKLTTTITPDGSIINEIILARENTLPDLPLAVNTSFVRFFVPEGSELLNKSGFENVDKPKLDLKGYKIDPDVADWEKLIVNDLVSGTSIGREAGKTFFGNWVTVKGGQTKTVTLAYKLPFKLKDLDHFSLLLQKQIGALPINFDYSVNFSGRQMLWKNFDQQTEETSQFNYSGKIDKDYLFGQVFNIY